MNNIIGALVYLTVAFIVWFVLAPFAITGIYYIFGQSISYYHACFYTLVAMIAVNTLNLLMSSDE